MPDVAKIYQKMQKYVKCIKDIQELLKKKNTQNIWKFLIFHEIIKNINNVGSIFMFIPKT